MMDTCKNSQPVPRRRAWHRACAGLVLWAGCLGLVACAMPAMDAADPAPEAVTAAEPTVAEEPTLQPTAPAEPAAEEAAPETDTAAEVPAEIDWTQHVTVSEDYYLLGDPEAPVLIVDASDFL